MAAWMLYLTGVGCVLGLAGLLAERGLRHLGRPVRWVWVGAMVLTLGHVLVLVLTRGDHVGASTSDRILLLAWSVASVALLANLRLSGWTLRRNERLWRAGRVGGHRVLVSAGFGPGVIGAARARVVLPQWVLDSDPSLRRLIVMHEMEHVRAADTRLLVGGLAVVALVPWCLPLWWQLHRLRGAIETDCDARVLAAAADPREYASTLVAIAGRRARDLAPVAALAPRGAELKRRIRLITGWPQERSRSAGLGFLAVAALVVIALGAVPVPEPPRPGLEETQPAAGFHREAIIILSVGGEGSEEPTSAR